MGPAIKNGNIELVDIFTPDEAVAPGGLMKNVTFRVRMHNNFAAAAWEQALEGVSTDKDLCQSEFTQCSFDRGRVGYCASPRMFFRGQEAIFDTRCLPLPIPTSSHTFDFSTDFVAPSEPPSLNDIYTIEAEIMTTGTETTSPVISSAIIWSESGSETVTTDPPAGDPPNGGGPFDDLLPEGLGRKLVILGAGYVVLKTVSETATEEAFN